MSSVQVLFFASLRDELGTDGLQVPVAGPISLADLLDALKPSLPAAGFTALCAESVRVALNQELIPGPCLINPGDEVAFLPPVTGG